MKVNKWIFVYYKKANAIILTKYWWKKHDTPQV